MPHLTISVLDQGKPSPLNLTDDDIIVDAEISQAIILQAGMESGKPSVALISKVEIDGKLHTIIAQTSMGLFEGVAGALKGATARWEDEAHGE